MSVLIYTERNTTAKDFNFQSFHRIRRTYCTKEYEIREGGWKPGKRMAGVHFSFQKKCVPASSKKMEGSQSGLNVTGSNWTNKGNVICSKRVFDGVQGCPNDVAILT